MKVPGTPVHHFNLDDYDPAECAAWMLRLIDDSPDKLAIIRMPPHRDDDDLQQIEDMFIAAYDIAKAARPALSIKIRSARDLHNGQPCDRIIVAIHEHQWVGGHCVYGCGDTRATAA